MRPDRMTLDVISNDMRPEVIRGNVMRQDKTREKLGERKKDREKCREKEERARQEERD